MPKWSIVEFDNVKQYINYPWFADDSIVQDLCIFCLLYFWESALYR